MWAFTGAISSPILSILKENFSSPLQLHKDTSLLQKHSSKFGIIENIHFYMFIHMHIYEL